MHAEIDLCYRHDIRPEDPAAIRAIVESSGFFSAAEVDVAEELVLERLSKGDASGYSFVLAERQGQLAGYACYGEIACTVGSFDLYWIVVDAKHQGQGIGRRLMLRAEELIARRGGRLVFVETSSRALYEPTRQFYLRCGYDQLTVIEDFYNEGDGKVILGKRLAPR